MNSLPDAANRQITFAAHGHVLTNANVWSADGKWIVYDVRSDAAGSNFNGDRIEAVNVDTGEVKLLCRSANGAHCGVATWHPVESEVVFILGPEHPTPEYAYGPSRRRGVMVHADKPENIHSVDARDLTPPFTAGALRGGSHVHIFSADGQRASFTYDDDVLSNASQRNVGICFPRLARVPKDHPRNHDGEYFSVLVTRTTALPRAGSDEISRAFEEAWVGTRAIVFQGNVVTTEGETISEVFIVDLPDDLAQPGDGPLEGTATQLPFPPRGVRQRRLTFTSDRKFPGIQGPRHWLRCAPDGSQIAFLMKDDDGIVQLWTISPNGGDPRQITRNRWPVASAFTWSPDGKRIVHVMDNSVCVTEVTGGETTRLTARAADVAAPRPEACVFSPNGRRIAFAAQVQNGDRAYNQVFVAEL